MLKKNLLYDTLLKKIIKYKNKYNNLKNQYGGNFDCKDLIDNKLGLNNRIGTCWNIVIQTILFFNKNFGDEFQTKLLSFTSAELVDTAVVKLELFLPCKLLDHSNKLLPETRVLLIRIIEGIKRRFTIKQTDFENPAQKIVPILERQNSMVCERSFAKDYFELFGIERKDSEKLHGTNNDEYLLTNLLTIIILGKFIDISILTEKNDTNYTPIDTSSLDDPSLIGIIINLKRDEIGHAMGFFTCSNGTNILVNNANIIEFEYKSLLKRMKKSTNYNLYYLKTPDTKSIVIIDETTKPQLDRNKKYYVISMYSLKVVDDSKIREVLVKNLENYNTIDDDNIYRFMSKIGTLDPRFKIFETIENQNIAQINEELATIPDINIKGHQNITLLNKAISTKNIEIVTIILAREPNIDDLNELLKCLINKGTVEIFNITLDYILTKLQIPNINEIKVKKESLLSFAIDIGRIEIIKTILQRTPTIVHGDFKALLIKSIKTNNEGIVELILEKIITIDPRRIFDSEILKSAITTNNFKIVDKIITIESINRRNFNELIEFSIESKNKQIIEKILELGSTYIQNILDTSSVNKDNFDELLELSIKTKNKTIIEKILTTGLTLEIEPKEQKQEEEPKKQKGSKKSKEPTEPKIINIKDITAFLKKAIDENFVDFVDIVLRLFPTIKKFDDKPIIFYAFEKDKLEIVKKILEYSQDININETFNSISILIYAIETKNLDIINKIISLHPDPNFKNAKDRPSKSALIYAIETKNLDIINKITSLVPDPNLKAPDKLSKTPLMYAIETNNLDIINKIISLHPDINLTDKTSKSALMYAIETNNLDIVNAILTANPKPDINAINKSGDSILHYALLNPNPLITKAILDQNPVITDLRDQVDKFKTDNPKLFL
jgi:ankyrin repeat protein